MNKILTTLIGASLLTGALYAGQHTSEGCKAHSQCQTSMKSDKGACNVSDTTMSKTAFELFEESFAQEDITAGG